MATYTQNDAGKHRIYSYGTFAIFNRRARAYMRRLQVLDFVGLALPLLVGGLVLSGIDITDKWLIAVGCVLAVQGVVFLWALIARWADKLEHSTASRTANREIAELYENCLVTAPSASDWDLLVARRKQQDSIDERYPPSEKERSYGMRQALYQFRLPCGNHDCGKVPTSLKPGDCPTCGKFNRLWVK